MKQFISIAVIFGLAFMPGALFAEARLDCDGGITYSTCAASNPDGAYLAGCPIINGYELNSQYQAQTYCTKIDTVWFRGVGASDCVTCVAGATKVNVSMQVGECGVYYNYCKCTTTASCTSGPWTPVRDGYESRIRSVAICSSCKNTTEYRCAAGYYGETTNGSTGCTRCLSSDGVYGTSPAGSKSITDCYLPTGTPFSDGIGSGTYTGDCYYKN